MIKHKNFYLSLRSVFDISYFQQFRNDTRDRQKNFRKIRHKISVYYMLGFIESVNPFALPIIAWNRISHLIREKKLIAVLEGAIRIVRSRYDRAKKNGMPHFQRVYNAGLYVLVFEYDIAILKNDALFAIRAWKKNFVARQLAVILYEAETGPGLQI